VSKIEIDIPQELKVLIEQVKDCYKKIMNDTKTGSIIIHVNDSKISRPSYTVK